MPGPFLSCGLLLTLGFLQVIQAQEPSGKPEAPTPKVMQTPIPLPRNSSERGSWDNPFWLPETVADLPALAASIATHTVAANCQPKSCTVLVTNFIFPDGNTSVYGMRLADTLSHELTSEENKLRVIDRSLLQNFLAKERVPAAPDHRHVIHWISDALDARFVVFGRTERADNGFVRLSIQLVDTHNKDWRIYTAIVNLGPLKSGESLEPVDPFGPLPEITISFSGQPIERVGVNGTTAPSCYYAPTPPYSEGTVRNWLIGSITAEAVVNSQGTLEYVRIVRGMPYGQNEITIATIRTWRCHPALKDGKPVPVIVPVTETFHQY
jgi:TolB-like protein